MKPQLNSETYVKPQFSMAITTNNGLNTQLVLKPVLQCPIKYLKQIKEIK